MRPPRTGRFPHRSVPVSSLPLRCLRALPASARSLPQSVSDRPVTGSGCRLLSWNPRWIAGRLSSVMERVGKTVLKSVPVRHAVIVRQSCSATEPFRKGVAVFNGKIPARQVGRTGMVSTGAGRASSSRRRGRLWPIRPCRGVSAGRFRRRRRRAGCPPGWRRAGPDAGGRSRGPAAA